MVTYISGAPTCFFFLWAPIVINMCSNLDKCEFKKVVICLCVYLYVMFEVSLGDVWLLMEGTCFELALTGFELALKGFKLNCWLPIGLQYCNTTCVFIHAFIGLRFASKFDLVFNFSQ